jgi:hypothetical protein
MRKMKLFSVFALLALLLSAGMGSAAAQKPPSDAQTWLELQRLFQGRVSRTLTKSLSSSPS